MILVIPETSLSKMHHPLLEASADLGASPAQTFKRVTLPLSAAGNHQRITLVFLPQSVLLHTEAARRRSVFPHRKYIENQFITVGEWNWKCHFHDHGGHHDGTGDGCP